MIVDVLNIKFTNHGSPTENQHTQIGTINIMSLSISKHGCILLFLDF